MAKRVAIIGGGITGLAAAYYLKKLSAGFPLEIKLIEPGELGGKLKTEITRGFVVEGGPDAFVSHKPWALELCRELGLESEIVDTNKEFKKTFLLRRGKLCEIPEGLMMVAPRKIWPVATSPLLSLTGKLRLAMEPFIRRGPAGGEESLGAFFERRFGREFYQRIAEPILSGIFSGDAGELELRATLPQLAALEEKYGSITRGLMAEPARPAGPDSSRTLFVSLKQGLGRMVSCLASLVGPDMLIRDRVLELTRLGDQWRIGLGGGGALDADAVIVAAPAWAAAAILGGVDRDLASLLKSIAYSSVATVSLGYKNTSPPKGYGFVAPKIENRAIMACSWSSSKFDGRAPGGHILVRAYLSGTPAAAGEAEIEAVARREVGDIMNLKDEPVLSRVFKWERGMPSYRAGHGRLVKDIEGRVSRHGGLILAGASYRGAGIPECVKSAQTAGRLALNCLHQDARASAVA